MSQSRLDSLLTVQCGACRRPAPEGAHVVLSPGGPDQHVLYCPTCCPCRKGR